MVQKATAPSHFHGGRFLLILELEKVTTMSHVAQRNSFLNLSFLALNIFLLRDVMTIETGY